MRAIENVFSGTGGQIDLLNTLYGGSSMTMMDVEREDERLVITLSAPGVNANSFNVLVEGNKLILYTLLVGTATKQADDIFDPGDSPQRLAVPMFLRVLDIPNFVEAGQIETIHEESKVVVLLPLKNEDQLHRRIDIKDLF
jgi:HSP20 family protein